MADETSQTVDQTPPSVEATIESAAQGGTESTCNNDATAATSGVTSEVETDKEKSLEYADELIEKGIKASKDGDFAEASDCFSRALEIRVAHYGELSPECVKAYYKYGCALLDKAQEEADPLGASAVPKKEENSEHESEKDGSVKSANGETSVSSSNAMEGSSNQQEGVSNEGSVEGGQEDGGEDSDAEELAEEDESDLDLAWKMLDVARAILEKNSEETVMKVDVLSALAEVALEREDIETSLSDYLKALSILEHLVEPDSRRIAELNFRICLCLEIGSKAQEAVPYCEKALSVCKARLQRLKEEVESSSHSTAVSTDLESGLTVENSSNTSQLLDSISDKQGEIEILTGLSSELEKRLEDLQQAILSPALPSDIPSFICAKAKEGENAFSGPISSSRVGTANSSGGFDSPTVSTAHTNGTAGVTHLGVVGRGVKRVVMSSVSSESNPAKKAELDTSADKRESNDS